MKGEGLRAKGEGTEGGRQDLLARTKQYALRAIRVFAVVRGDEVGAILGKQLLRAATFVGAQYREAQRAKSSADFVSKVEGMLQELEESRYWLELLIEADILPSDRIQPLIDETTELIAIFVTIAKNARPLRP